MEHCKTIFSEVYFKSYNLYIRQIFKNIKPSWRYVLMMIYQCNLNCKSHVVHEIAKIPLFSSCLVLKVLVVAGFSAVKYPAGAKAAALTPHDIHHTAGASPVLWLPLVIWAESVVIALCSYSVLFFSCPFMVLDSQFYVTDNVLSFAHKCFLIPYYMQSSNPLTDHHQHGYAHSDCLFSHSSSKQQSNC